MVIFTATGYTTKAYFSSITSGDIKDHLIPKVCSIGCLGYASKKDNEVAYRKWHGIISRCYDPNDKQYKSYGAKGITICERWYRFDYFLDDISSIDGYNKELFNNGILQLDKDIKQQGITNKIYSKDTCCFVTNRNNCQYREYSIQKDFIATSPTNEIHVGKNIREFSRKHNLVATHISRCLNGLSVKHKGWKFKFKEVI